MQMLLDLVASAASAASVAYDIAGLLLGNRTGMLDKLSLGIYYSINIK